MSDRHDMPSGGQDAELAQAEAEPIDFSVRVAEHLRSDVDAIAADWLARLGEILPVRARATAPWDSLLDHLHAILLGLADDLLLPADQDVMTGSAVLETAHDLGTLRFQQDATPHQILCEYDLLADVVEARVETVLRASEPPASPAQVLLVLTRLHRGMRVLVRTSVDAFTFLVSEMSERRRQRLQGFNRMASHELRRPLQQLSTVLALLGAERANAEEAAWAREAAARGLEQATELLDGIESIAHAEDGAHRLSTQLVDLGSLVGDVLRRLRSQAAAHGVRLDVRGLKQRLYTDPHALEMILLNLLTNAIKYSDPQKTDRWVLVEGNRADGDSGAAVLRVRDNGLGIPEDMQDRVFERFVRVPRDGAPGGSGLGLAIVAECAEFLGCTLRLHSEEGQGSTFELSIPDGRISRNTDEPG